jgi:hypothetical protein
MLLLKNHSIRFAWLQDFSLQLMLFSGTILSFGVLPTGAQVGSPVPGGWTPPTQSQPDVSMSAPIPGSDRIDATGGRGFPSGVPASTSKYAQLPLSLADAKSRMQELNTMAAVAKSQDVLESVNRLSEWLGDMCDAHNKMASTFGKHEQTKNQALAERQAVQHFSQVRNQAQLLKAQLLINQHRFPEALTPLVDIVIAEPLSSTGQTAYRKLKEMGFSEDAAVATEATVAPGVAGALGMPNTVGTSTVEVVKRSTAPSKNPSTAAAPGSRKVTR